MIFQTHIPRYPLDRFINLMIYYDGVQHDHQVDRFLPNGDTEILIDFNDAPQFIYDNESLKEIQACHNIWASGVRTEPITIPAGTNATMMVISFKKGMAYPFFPFPMSEIANSVVDADLIWDSGFAYLRERLLETTDIDLRFQLVENFLIDRFRVQMIENRCVSFAVEEMTLRPDALCIGRLNEKIGYSQKHFISMFKKHVGITPKAYTKIMRFQKAVNNIEVLAAPDWSAVSQNCGFYDQSHFINDFKLLSGFTPQAYIQQKRDYLNYVAVG